ncbi:MAG: PH domain-containing protein [Desulfurobacteriaceae bacterium]
MDRKIYRTDKFTFLGYALLVLTYSLFFGLLVVRSGGVSINSLIFVLLVLPVAAYFFFLSRKKVIIDNEGIKVFGITGKKEFKWRDIQEVSVSAGRKYFLFIADKEGKLAVIDDSTENFKELLQEIKKKVSPNKLPENFDSVINSYRRSYGSIILIYIASLILLFVLFQSL